MKVADQERVAPAKRGKDGQAAEGLGQPLEGQEKTCSPEEGIPGKAVKEP